MIEDNPRALQPFVWDVRLRQIPAAQLIQYVDDMKGFQCVVSQDSASSHVSCSFNEVRPCRGVRAWREGDQKTCTPELPIQVCKGSTVHLQIVW